MDDPPRGSPPNTDQALSLDCDPKLLEAVEAAAARIFESQKGLLEGLAGVGLHTLADEFEAQESAVKRALPSSEDYWMDLKQFSIMPMPWGLALTEIEFWQMTSREWLARWRVWKFHNPNTFPALATGGNSSGRERGISTPEDPQPASVAQTDNGAGARKHTSIERAKTAITVIDIKGALVEGGRKQAVQLRCKMDECDVKTIRTEAFQERRAMDSTKVTAFNRWQASRKDAPSWADPLIVKRLLKEGTTGISPTLLPAHLH